MWDEEQIMGSLDVTPEQRQGIFRVGMKHRNNRLITDALLPATEACDSDPPYIPQLCGIKKD